jgi:hypothetical protein
LDVRLNVLQWLILVSEMVWAASSYCTQITKNTSGVIEQRL